MSTVVNRDIYLFSFSLLYDQKLFNLFLVLPSRFFAFSYLIIIFSLCIKLIMPIVFHQINFLLKEGAAKTIKKMMVLSSSGFIKIIS